MEMTMEMLFMAFMVIVTAMALFAIMVVFRDIVNEVIHARRQREKETRDIVERAERVVAQAQLQQMEQAAACAAAEPVPEPEPVPVIAEPVVEEAPVEAIPAVEETVEETVEAPVEEAPVAEEVAEEPEAETEEGMVSFSASQRQTLEEKYLALSSRERGWYDEIIKYAAAVEGSKRFKNIRYEEYKVGKNRLVRVLIKRGIIHCEFMLQNSDFKNYVNENKISVRQSATTMRVENEATVEAVKSSIDIAVAAIAEEKEHKKQLAREKRKAAKAQESAQKEQA